MRRRKWASLVLAAFCLLGSTQKAAAAEPSAPVPTSAPTEAPEAEDKKAQLAIDSEHLYEGMEQSFAQGYVPAVKENVLYLAVPFTVRGSLKEQELTVGLDLGKRKMPLCTGKLSEEGGEEGVCLRGGKSTGLAVSV